MITLERSDITKQDIDAIVNAANSHLAHGGGLARAIADAAGPELVADSEATDFVPIGSAVATRAGALPCKYVIHAVGPVWSGGDGGEPDLLASAYRSAVEVADELGCRSIAFPAISTGIFGYPVELAAPVALAAVRDALTAHPAVETARFCLFSPDDLAAFTEAATELGISTAAG